MVTKLESRGPNLSLFVMVVLCLANLLELFPDCPKVMLFTPV